jgi:hypothetical protein
MAQSVADQAASKTDEALASPVDAFILFNERENVVESIVGGNCPLVTSAPIFGAAISQ